MHRVPCQEGWHPGVPLSYSFKYPGDWRQIDQDFWNEPMHTNLLRSIHGIRTDKKIRRWVASDKDVSNIRMFYWIVRLLRVCVCNMHTVCTISFGLRPQSRLGRLHMHSNVLFELTDASTVTVRFAYVLVVHVCIHVVSIWVSLCCFAYSLVYLIRLFNPWEYELHVEGPL